MSNIALTSSNDLDLVGHRVKITTGEEAIEQNLRVRLRFFLGEWFLDASQGIPYFRVIFIKSPIMLLVRSLFRQAILSTTGISTVDSLDLELDKAARELSVSFRATMNTGAVLTYNNFVIEV